MIHFSEAVENIVIKNRNVGLVLAAFTFPAIIIDLLLLGMVYAEKETNRIQKRYLK